MPRTARAAVGGVVYHLLNRGNGRMEIFREPEDRQAFIELMIDAKRRADQATGGRGNLRLLPHAQSLASGPASPA